MDTAGAGGSQILTLESGKDSAVITLRITALVIAVFTAVLFAEKPEASLDPKISSIYPLGGQPGHPYEAAIRGKNLKGARGLWFPAAGIRARVTKVESPDATNDLVRAELTIEPGAPIGPHRFRVVTPLGISNEIELQVSGAGPPLYLSQDEPISQFPAIIEGRIAKSGDVNSYIINVDAGQTITLEAHSGFKAFDPSIAI